MKQLLTILALTAISSSAMADTIRTSDGISCSFDADDSPWEVTAYSEYNQDNQKSPADYYNRNIDETSVGLKIEFSFGGPERLDCGKLYKLELRTKEARVKQLESKLAAMEAAAAANW